MSIRERIRNRKKKRAMNQAEPAWYGEGSDTLMDWLGLRGKAKEEISEVTYFTCLKKLSEAIGKLPLKYYQETEEGKIRADPTEACRLMTIRPNPYMTAVTMWTTTEFACQHYGNGFIWMQTLFRPEKYGGEFVVKGMYPMSPECVRVLMDDAGIFGYEGKLWYEYTDPKTGKIWYFRNEEVLHFKTWMSNDGIMGRSVRDVLKDTVGGALQQQETMNTLYKQGVTASMVMYYTSDIDEKRRKLLQQKFADQLTKPLNAGKVIPIPSGLQLQPLSMKLTDSQFYELRKYSALQIAAAFGIKPNQINNYEKSSYSSSEMQQLDFLADTLSFRIRMYEDEINGKVLTQREFEDGKYYKFNERAILRADTASQMEALAKGVNNFIYKPNEARDYLDLPKAKGGDELIGNGNFIRATLVGTQYSQEGGEDGED